jgi:hypothetical protein
MPSQQLHEISAHHIGEGIYRNQFCKEHYRNHLAIGGDGLRYITAPKMKSSCDVDFCENPVAFKEKAIATPLPR